MRGNLRFVDLGHLRTLFSVLQLTCRAGGRCLRNGTTKTLDFGWTVGEDCNGRTDDDLKVRRNARSSRKHSFPTDQHSKQRTFAISRPHLRRRKQHRLGSRMVTAAGCSESCCAGYSKQHLRGSESAHTVVKLVRGISPVDAIAHDAVVPKCANKGLFFLLLSSS
jgi:hypothetical protein